MPVKFLKAVSMVMLLVLLLAACSPSNPISTGSAPFTPPTMTMRTTPSPTVTQTPAPASPTATAQPTAMQRPSLRPSPTVTFTPLAPTPIALVNTALPEPGEAISPENASKVGALARWGEGSIHAAAFSPDGQILALASSLGVYLYDLPTLQLDHFFPTAEAIGAVSFSADGALLAAGAQDGGVSILEAASGKHLHQLAPQGLPVADLAFLKDERQITVLYQDHFQDLTQTAVWQFADEVKSSGESYEQTGIKAAISPRSQFFTLGTLHYIEIHPIGSIKDFQLFTTLDTLDNFALADDGRTLALAKNDRIQLWDAQEDRQIWEARVTANPSSRDSLPATCEGIWVDRGYSIVNQMAFSPDGKTLAVAIYGGVVQILNGKDGSLIQQFDTDVERMIFSQDSQWLAVLPGNGTLELHNSKDGSLASRLSGHANNFPSIAFFPDGAALAAAASDGRIRFWSIPQSKQIASLKTAADHIAFSSDGHYLASADPNGQLNFWDMLTGNLNRTSQAHADGLWGLVFSPDGHKLYTGGFDCTIREWDGRNGALIRTILKNSPSITLWRSTMAISPDGSFLVTLDLTGNLRQYWIQENRLSDALPLPFQEIIFELAISPDGRQLAAGSDYGIFIYDLESQQVVAQSEWGGNQIAYSPDGQLIAIGDQDYIRLVDSQDGRLLATLTGPRGAISSLAFSPKSNYLAAGSQDGTIRVWGVIQ